MTDVTSRGAGRISPEIRICLFDIMGTVVDSEGCVNRDTAATLQRAGLGRDDVDAVVERYVNRLGQLMGEVTAGERAWEKHRELRRLALRETVAARQLSALAPDVEEQLSGVIHRLDPWPDSAAALRRLQEGVVVVGLSNADLAELVGLSRHGGLSWHTLLSGEFVQAFKPSPVVYQMAVRLLDAKPSQVLMVAAHPWDLRAAAEQGLATAYIARPGAERPAGDDDDFDIVVDDLDGLASVLAGQ